MELPIQTISKKVWHEFEMVVISRGKSINGGPAILVSENSVTGSVAYNGHRKFYFNNKNTTSIKNNTKHHYYS